MPMIQRSHLHSSSMVAKSLPNNLLDELCRVSACKIDFAALVTRIAYLYPTWGIPARLT
jgi:hypothetical protein